MTLVSCCSNILITVISVFCFKSFFVFLSCDYVFVKNKSSSVVSDLPECLPVSVLVCLHVFLSVDCLLVSHCL